MVNNISPLSINSSNSIARFWSAKLDVTDRPCEAVSKVSLSASLIIAAASPTALMNNDLMLEKEEEKEVS